MATSSTIARKPPTARFTYNFSVRACEISTSVCVVLIAIRKHSPLKHLLFRAAGRWLGAELNRRHVDFQSTALPTELPSRENAWRPVRRVIKAENVQPSTHNSEGFREQAARWTISEFVRQIDGAFEQAQIMTARNFDPAELAQVRRKPLGVEQRKLSPS